MTTKDIYQFAFEIGKKSDIKEASDYPDSRIIYSKTKRKIKKIAIGIDIGCFEIFFAKKILKCDLIISHHPLSNAANNMADMVFQQVDNLSSYGADKNAVSPLIENAYNNLRREAMVENFYREEQMARYLDIDLMNLHTIADNVAIYVFKNLILEKKCSTLGNFIKAILQLPEFQMASQSGQNPFIANGQNNDPLGKVSFSEFIGGQEASTEIFLEMKKAGIDTIIAPHLSKDFFESAVKAGLRVIYCGHLAGDSLGMNYILDRIIDKFGKIKIFPMGGILRK